MPTGVFARLLVLAVLHALCAGLVLSRVTLLAFRLVTARIGPAVAGRVLIPFRLLALALPLGLRRRRLLRRSRSVDLERPPFRLHLVRLLGPRVAGHGAILELHAGLGPERLGHERLRHGRGLPRTAHEQFLTLLDRGSRQPRLHAHARQPEVGIDRPHAHRHRRSRRHLEHLRLGHLDRHLGRQVGHHLDAMLEAAHDVGLRPAGSPGPRPVDEPIRRELRTTAVGVELERERAGRARTLRPLDRQRHVPPPIAAEIDGRRLERPVRLGGDGHPRPFDGPDVALPGKRLLFASGVVGIAVANLPHQQRRRVTEHHPDPLAAGVAGGDRQLHRLIEAALLVGHHHHPHAAGAGRERHRPRRRRGIGRAVVAKRPHVQLRFFTGIEPVDPRREHELPAAIELGHATHDVDLPPGSVRRRRILARHPPRQPRGGDAHPRRRGEAAPGRDQSGRRDDEALRCQHLIETDQSHQRRQDPRQPHRGRAIDHAFVGHARQPPGRPAPQRLDHGLRRFAGMLLDQDGVDQIVVELGVIPLDGPRGEHEIDPVSHQRHEPSGCRCHRHPDAGRQPSPPRPRGQTAGHEPVLDEHPDQHPRHGGHCGGQQEGGHHHALEVGDRGGEPAGEVLLRLGTLDGVAAPGPNGQRIACLIGYAGHGLDPSLRWVDQPGPQWRHRARPDAVSHDDRENRPSSGNLFRSSSICGTVALGLVC